MFPAYSGGKNKPTEKSTQSKSLFPISAEQVEVTRALVSTDSQWLYNKSFVPPKTETDLKISSEAELSEEIYNSFVKKSNKNKKNKEKKKQKKKDLLSDSDTDTTKIRHREKSKKKSDTYTSFHKYEKQTISEEMRLYNERNLESDQACLIDENYQTFFAKISKDLLKKAYFFEDLPGLTYRNAFRINRTGDKNNLCFDSVNRKFLPKYQIPKIEIHQLVRNKQISTRKLIRQQIKESKKNRYFVRKTENNDQTVNNRSSNQTVLSKKMRLYLDMKKEIEEVNFHSLQTFSSHFLE